MALPIISICFAVLALVFLSCKWAITFFQRRKFRLKHHCAKVPRGSLDPFLGLDRIVRLNNAMKQKRYLQFSRQTFEEHGNTYTTKLLLRNQFCKADPEIFKAVLSTQFVEFDAGWRRAKAFEPLGGTESVLTTEGKGWKHARAMLRPGMSQKLAVDYEALEIHWGKLFNILSKNGETVDLQDLFFRFVRIIPNVIFTTNSCRLWTAQLNSSLENRWAVWHKQLCPALLLSEVDSVLAGQLATADSLKKLPYMDQVMKETLRLWSPVPVTMRIANKDTTLPRGGGPDGSSPIFIAKGSEVLLSFNVLHRRKDIWGQNADDFVPERWSSIDTGWSYLAFSNGPRICPGQRRALAEVAYITARLLQSVARVKSRDEQPFEEFMKVTMQNARDVLVGVFVD